MRIVIAIPRQDRATGNHITGERFRRGLERLGHRVALVETAPEDSELAAAVAAFRPQLALLLHAWRSGCPWLALPAELAVPGVVLLTGTDLNRDLFHPQRGEVVEAVLSKAAAVVTQNRLTAEALRRDRPDLAPRLHHLPPGIELGTEPYPLRARHGLAADRPLFLCPAGLRPVKGLLELLELCDPLAERHPLQVAFCGPPLNDDYRRRFLAALAKRPWARYLGSVPPAAMPAAMAESDVILNNAFAEGLPNALVEAATLGRPILARDIVGNAAVVRDGVNGLLYRDAPSFEHAAERLLCEAGLLVRLSQPDRERYSTAAEARRLAALCERVPD